MDLGRLREAVTRRGADEAPVEDGSVPAAEALPLDIESEESARERLLSEVLAALELVLDADGAALWREEPDHSLVLTASRSIPEPVLQALDRYVTTPLQSIMERWPQSPLVAVPLDDPSNPLPEEMRAVCTTEGIGGLAGVPARIPGETLGLLIVMHRRAHAWTVRDLRLATGFAGQLATALQNARLYASVQALANRLAAIHELSLRLNQLRDVDAIGEAIVAEAGRLVDCDTVRVYRLDRRGGLFRPVAASGTFVGIDGPPLEALTVGGGETLPGWVAKRNEPLIIPDASVERRAIVRSTTGPESVLLVPLSYGGEVHGVLVVSKAGFDRYGPEDEQALSIFARYAAQAIVTADNFERLAGQQAVLEQQLAGERRLLEVNEQLVSALDPRRVLEQIADTLGSVVRHDGLTIYRADRETGRVEAVLSRHGAGDGHGPAVDEGLTSWVIGRGEPVCANDIDTAEPATEASSAVPPTAAEATESRSIIVVPLRVHGDVVGTLNLTRRGGSDDPFTEHEFELSKLFAGQASIALQNAEAHVTVATRADLDSLTGLRNHGTFERDLAALTAKDGEPFGLLMMDLDSFKAFNDTYGHPAGDTLLRTVSRAIVSATRQNDRAYRYGGDEFALLLHGATREQADEVAARIRATVRGFALGSDGNEVGACIGVAHWPEDGPSAEALVRVADEALYRAKAQRGQPEAAAAERHGDTLLGILLEAARGFLAASSPEEVAMVAARQAAALAGTSDAFVALPVAAAPGSGGHSAGLCLAAGVGVFAAQVPGLDERDGLWQRVWRTGHTLTEVADDADRGPIGIRLGEGGRRVGLLGLALARGVMLSPQRLETLARLADLAAEALHGVERRSHRGMERTVGRAAPAASTRRISPPLA